MESKHTFLQKSRLKISVGSLRAELSCLKHDIIIVIIHTKNLNIIFFKLSSLKWYSFYCDYVKPKEVTDVKKFLSLAKGDEK